MAQLDGYIERLMPVPTPTSSTESPGRIVHLLDGLDAPGVERRAENEVVDVGQFLVDPRDEVVLDNRDRQRARCRVAADGLGTLALVIE